MTNETTSQQEEKRGFTNQEIQAIEANRHDLSSWNVIHLLRDGNYWHANEWSAWLMSVVIYNEMKRRYPDEERVPINPVKKYAKNINGEYIFVGCQEKSFDKFLPKELQISWTPVDNLRIDVAIELPAELGELSYERLLQMYLEWKTSVPLTKDKNNKNGKGPDNDNNISDNRKNISPGIMAIITKVLSFPLSKRSPYQAHEFIGEIQQELASHL